MVQLHWLKQHGPHFKKFPEIKPYTQLQALGRRRDNSDLRIDGIAVLEFESKDTLSNQLRAPRFWKHF